MVAHLTPLKPVKCSYDDCFHSFDTEEQMRTHLKDKGDHPFYCGKTPNQEKLNSGFAKCDFHGKTWDDLLAHKVENMMPWIAGSRKDESSKKLNHIVCEFCGLDFGSLSGREAHRKKMHTADQHIACKGHRNVRDHEGKIMREDCGMVFGRPSQLIHHIESGNCTCIKPKMLEDERRQKRVVKQILHDPSRFNVRNLAEPLENDDSTASGGVGLMDLEDSSQATGQRPMSPTMSHTSKASDHSHISGGYDRGFPGLSSSVINNLDAATNALSIDASEATPAIHGSGILASSPRSDCCNNDNAGTLSDVGTADNGLTSSANLFSPWSVGNTSSKLFGAPKLPHGVRPNWDAINESRKRTQIEDDKSNMFYSRFWDLNDEAYNPRLFLVPEREPATYRCPFHGCHSYFMHVKDFGDHLRQSHAIQPKTCPICGKVFDNLTKLIQHCEASSRGSKCAIARQPGYSKFLFEITGGLLSATKPPAEPIYGYKTEPTTEKHEELTARTSALNEPGVRDYDYEAVAPSRLGREK